MSYFSHSWLPFIYLYGLGGLLFISGIIITIKSGSFNLKNHVHQQWLWVLVFGFIWYMMMHGVLTLVALGYNKFAVLIVLLVIGLSILAYFQFRRKTLNNR